MKRDFCSEPCAGDVEQDGSRGEGDAKKAEQRSGQCDAQGFVHVDGEKRKHGGEDGPHKGVDGDGRVAVKGISIDDVVDALPEGGRTGPYQERRW